MGLRNKFSRISAKHERSDNNDDVVVVDCDPDSDSVSEWIFKSKGDGSL